jgi:endo-1,4-beta-xylanase
VKRRTFLAGALALSACDQRAKSQTPPPVPASTVPPFRSVAGFPIGTCAQASHLDDPAWVALAKANCSQLTPEWEMKMEYIVQPDGSFRFDRPDALAAFARRNRMRLYGTTLVWYSQRPAAFEGLDEGRVSFGRAYDNYITAVVGRYRAQAVGWDVVNEAVAEDGVGWRDSLWSQRLGDFDHMKRAFDVARAADPNAVLFLNDYNLESIPKKLDTFQRLVDRLLSAGAPLGGLGTQTHLAADTDPATVTGAVEALGRFGLPVHISELDVSLARTSRPMMSRQDKIAGQARVYEAAASALLALPERQRFGLTLWGLRDRDSWLKRDDATDAPAPFDDVGRPKAAAQGFVAGLYGNASASR